MNGTRRKFFYRFARPFAIGLLVATSAMVWVSISNLFLGEFLYGIPGAIVAICGIITIIVVATGLAVDSERAIDEGIMIGSAVWMAVAMFDFLHYGANPFGFIALGWSVAAGGV